MGAVIPGFSSSGNVLYGQIRSAFTAQVANGSGLEVYNPSNWSLYSIIMPEQTGSGCYILTVPGYLAAGRYFVGVYLCTISSPTPGIGDTPIDFVFFDWDGGNVIGLGSALNMGAVNGSTPAAINLALSANAFVAGTAAAGTLTNVQMTTGLTATVPNIYAGRTMYFLTGVNKGLAVLVTAYTVTGGRLTFIAYNNLPAPAAPGVGDTFLII